MPDILCLKTTVKNTSGAARIFSYLPPHGHKLANNEQKTFDGDLNTLLAAQRPAIQAAFQADLLAGRLTVISTPSPILFDATLAEAKQLIVQNDRLYTANPCWAATVDFTPVQAGTTTTAAS